MKLYKIIILLLVSFNVYSQGFYEDRLFVKVKDVYANDLELTENKDINLILNKEEVKEFKHAFVSKEMHSVYIVIFHKPVKLEEYIYKISEIGIVDYAEKIPIYNLFFTPNDPQLSSQWNLAKIQATQAWNIHQGTSPVKIAITDDGFLMNHEDLTSQWAVNTAEIAANGIDDDGNGYVDDWRGWDAGNNDNDPSAVSPTNSYFTHGTHVAGISAAATNNSLGIASIGFNCKLIPVKIANNSGFLTGAYQGLDYAINAIQPDVINMSWGGGDSSITYQILFNLAYSKGIVCVAAAGNNNSTSKKFPAGYNHVISVASTDNADAKSSFSNYGTWIDVSAPGSSILSCLAGSTSSYGNLSGTSMAAPLVSGLCALMKSYNPMPVDSIEACLKRTCDNINSQNSSYIGLLGAGRINALQALQCLTKKPMSQFRVRDTFQCTGKSVRYEATSVGIPTLTYQWSFPGGSPLTSTSKNQQVTYSTSGYKTATLITCNSLGCDTIVKTNVVNIDTPKAWLVGRNYTSYNTNAVIITVSFKGNPPFSVTLTDGTNNFTQNNIKSNPYYFSIVPVKDTSYITISAFSDSSCVGNKYGKDTIYKIINSNVGSTSYCESSFNFNGSYTNVVKIVPQNGSAWKDLYSTNGFTWECWFNLGNRSIGTAQESIVVASDAVLCEDLGLWFNFPWAGAGTFGFVASGQSGCSAPHVVASTTMSFSPNTWYHAAGVMDYTNNIVRLYVNGTQVATTALTLSMSQRMQNNVAVTIGNQDVNYNPYSGGFTPFKGKVDEVRFWNIAKTQAQIQADMKVCLPASTPNLVAYFKGDEGTGTNTVSKINGNFIGVLQNNASWSTQVDSVKNCTICQSTSDCDTTNLNSGKVLHLNFNGNTNDNSGNGNHATNYGATPVAGKDGVANTAYKFNGTSNYMEIPNSASLNPSSAITLTAIVKLDAHNPNPGWYCSSILAKGSDGSSGAYGMRINPKVFNSGDTNSATVYGYYYKNGGVDIDYNVAFLPPYFTKNAWTCLVYTYDGDTSALYVNGILKYKYKSNVNLLSPNGENIRIGRSLNTFPGPDQYFLNGVIDDIRIYNRALASSEVKGYCGTCNIVSNDCDTTNLNTGKVLHLDFNGNTQDKSGNGNHATNYGATAVAGKDGVANTAYRFDSTNYMSVAHHSSLNLRSFTLTAILKPNKFNTNLCYGNCIMAKGANSQPGQWALVYGPADAGTTCVGRDTTLNNFLFCGNTCAVPWYIPDTPRMKSGNWNCVVFTYDSLSKSAKMYIDGKLRHQWTTTWDLINSQNTANLLIGMFAGTGYPYFIQATIDDIRIYNRVLAPSEVKGYCGTCTVISPPPIDCDTTNLNTGKVLHLDFNGNTQDKSGNGNHATNYGATAAVGKDGILNTAYKFNGTSNYMQISNSSSLNPDTAITLTAKLKVDGYYSLGWYSNNILAKGVDNTNGYYTLRYANDANYNSSDTNNSFFYGQSTNDGSIPLYNSLIDKPPYINKNQWYCVVYTIESNDTCKLYVDGVLRWKFKSSNTNLGTNTQNLLIGKSLNTNSIDNFWLNATVDDIRIYNRALAASEVKGYCGTCNPVIIKCDSAKKYSYTKCKNDTLLLTQRTGTNFQWSPSVGLSSSNIKNPKCFVNTNTTYFVLFTDSSGCQIIDTVLVNVKNPANYLPLNDQLICQGDSVQLGISIPATNISWSPNSNISNPNSPNPYFYPTTSTRYYLQFVDSIGCTQYDTVDINVKICCAARAKFKVSDSSICFGKNVTITNQCKGTITSYNWNFGNAIPNIDNTANLPIISFPSGGYYPLRLIVSNGICFDTMIKNISVIQFKPYAGRDSSSCLASLTVNLGEDAISTWDYNWVPSSNLNDSKIANPVCTILNDSVTYIVEAKDQWSGCKFYDTVTIKTNTHIDSFSSFNRICFGDSVNFNSTYIKQTGRYFYTLKTTNGLCDSILYVKYVEVLKPKLTTYSAETYCDYFIDSKGKRHDVSFTLKDTIKSKTMNCDSLINVRTINIYKAVTTLKELKACNEVTFKGKKYRTTQNKVDSTKVKGIVSGCDSLITLYNVVILPNPKATISASKPNPIMFKDSVVLTANGGGTYRWTFNNSTNQSIVHRALDTHSKKYIVRVTDTSTTCWDSAVYIVQAIYPDTCYYGIPNVFTPNGDGLNDIFIPNMDDCTDLKLFVIYNRWGEKMFETNEKKGWDGNYKNHPAPYGVYVYYIEFNTLWGIRIYKGSVTLIR